MRILVTGGAGFIGSQTADALLPPVQNTRQPQVPPVNPSCSASTVTDDVVHGISRSRTRRNLVNLCSLANVPLLSCGRIQKSRADSER